MKNYEIHNFLLSGEISPLRFVVEFKMLPRKKENQQLVSVVSVLGLLLAKLASHGFFGCLSGSLTNGLVLHDTRRKFGLSFGQRSSGASIQSMNLESISNEFRLLFWTTFWIKLTRTSM